MDIKIKEIVVERAKTELLVVPLTEDRIRGPLMRRLDRGLKGQLSARMKKQQFSAAAGSSLLLPTQGTLPAPYLLLLGVAPEGPDALHPWRQVAAFAARWSRPDADSIRAR